MSRMLQAPFPPYGLLSPPRGMHIQQRLTSIAGNIDQGGTAEVEKVKTLSWKLQFWSNIFCQIAYCQRFPDPPSQLHFDAKVSTKIFFFQYRNTNSLISCKVQIFHKDRKVEEYKAPEGQFTFYKKLSKIVKKNICSSL